MTDRLVDSSDQVRKLFRLQLVMTHILTDDLCREMRVVCVGIHDRHPKTLRF
jgi:hypothetical protein